MLARVVGQATENGTLRLGSRTFRLIQSQVSAVWGRLVGSRTSFARDTVISFAGAILARVITLASLPLVTRVYDPGALGAWAIILTLSTFVVPLATMRYDVALVIAPTRRLAASLVVVMAACTAVTACVIAVTITLAPASFLEAISGLGGDDQKLLAFVPLVLVALALQASVQAWLVREHRFGLVSLVQLGQATFTAVATLALPVFAGANAVTATAAATLGLALATTIAVSACLTDVIKRSRWRPVETARLAAIRFKVYPTYFMPYSLSAGLVERVVQVVLASAYSIGALGAFYVARQLVMAPATLLAGSLRQVLFAHSARETDLAYTRRRVRRILDLLVDLVAPALAFCLLWLEPALKIVMGDDWARLSHFAWWILFPASAYLFTGWLDRLWDVTGRQRTAVVLQLVSDAILIALALLSWKAGLDEIGMVAALSVGTALYNLIWLGMTLRLIGSSYGEMLTMAARLGGLGAIWIGVHFLIASYLPGAMAIGLAALLLLVSLTPPLVSLASRLRANTDAGAVP